eukprot:COSAG02_NODE_1856_length_10648_cov_8.834581_9_plen_57_part_00
MEEDGALGSGRPRGDARTACAPRKIRGYPALGSIAWVGWRRRPRLSKLRRENGSGS